jgi:uncharacterized repeat protein (TIGR02543 family)
VKRGLLPLLLLLPLALGVASAGGHALATTRVVVEVIGGGTVVSEPSGIKCGNGKKTCDLTFTDGSITLNANGNDDWTFDSWDSSVVADCTLLGDQCDLNGAGDHVVTAYFNGPPGPSRTLSVSTSGSGNVDGGSAGEIDCGSGTDCSWPVLDDSTLTVLETPDADNVFTGWGGACSGTGSSCTVEMSGDRSINATWAGSASTATLSVNVKGTGTVKGAGINCNGPGSCSANEPLNSTVTLTASPSDGFVFTGWTDDCVGSGATCTLTMDSAHIVTATFAPTLSVTINGNGAVTGGSGAINCGGGASICTATFAQNSSVTLLATPATGATFTGWTGACGGTATTCTVLMSDAKSVTATFSGGGGATSFLLSVSVTGNGRVTGGSINCGLGATACAVSVTANGVVTLTATPDTGATFAGWGGACAGTITTCTVSMTSAKSVSATFTGGTSTASLTVAVTGSGTVTGGGINCGNGGSACSANVALGSSVTLTASPAAGASFTGWGGACSGAASSCTVSMSSAKLVTATFTTAATPGTLTIIAGGRGTVSTSAGACGASGPKKTCVQHFAAGKKVVLTATPLSGAVFIGWGGACAGSTSTCTVVLSTAKTVTATFSGTVGHAGLTSLGPPRVTKTAAGFQVTLRFNSTAAGLARVRGLRAGRVGVSLTLHVAAGHATIGPFPVAKGGYYTFEVTLAGRRISWTACLGRCFRAAPGPPFLLTREPPTVTRSGDVWSVTLHLRANGIADDHVRAYRGTRLLVNQHFLGHTGEIILGPFLLGPGSYTIRLTATDAYGRVRTLTWIVALAR